MFDPILITLQIVAMQCGYYFSKGSIFVAAATVFDVNLTLGHLFTGQYIQLTAFSGILESCVNFLSATAGAWLLSVVVEKSKKCVDFTFTLYFIDFLVCCFYEGMPSEWEWWMIQVLSFILMATAGEYFCAMKELQDIPLYQRASTGTGDDLGH